MSDSGSVPDAYDRIQDARSALSGFVRDAYTSTQFVVADSQAASDEKRAGSDHIPNRLVEGLVASVADHLYAWLRASEPPQNESVPLLRIYADHTLWRAILEATATGVWLLSPPDSEDRIRRGVRLALYEWASTGPVERPGRPLDEVAARTKDHLRRISERVCARMHWEVADLEKKRLGPGAIVKAAQHDLGANGSDLFFWWTTCSRYAHAQSTTAILRARRTHIDTPHGGTVDVETDEELVAEMLEFAVGVLNVFTALTRDRGLLRMPRVQGDSVVT